jgi:cysteine-rich repeat protein
MIKHLLSLLPVLTILGLAGCDASGGHGHHHHGGGGDPGPGYECVQNQDCAAGCYCGAGTCTEAGFCGANADCPVGYQCDGRSSCVPAPTPPPTGCATLTTEAACVADPTCRPLFTASDCTTATGATCRVGEPGCTCATYTFAACEATPAPVCGDGVVQAPEQCDDGNLVAGDGCSATCTIEPKASCGGAVTCMLGAPACPADQVPTIVNGCYSGQCVAIAQCDVPPPCDVINTEHSCLARATCGAIYSGSDCTSPNGTACMAGSTNCTCATFTFAGCGLK